MPQILCNVFKWIVKTRTRPRDLSPGRKPGRSTQLHDIPFTYGPINEPGQTGCNAQTNALAPSSATNLFMATRWKQRQVNEFNENQVASLLETLMQESNGIS